MKKFSLTLLAAGAMAMAGMAQADAIFYPDGTMVDLGDNGIELSDSGMDTTVLGAGSSTLSDDSLSLSSDSSLDTTVLGAAPATVTTVTTAPLVYVQPNINWDRTTALTQMRSNSHLLRGHSNVAGTSATATFDSPQRAGEVTTMTNGQPNMLTNNSEPMVVGSYHIAPSAVTGPYYVFSY